MDLDASARPWSGRAFRHIPANSPHGVLDFRFAGRAADNRWNQPGEPTLYLASDPGVALAEFACHFREDRSLQLSQGAVERAVFQLSITVDGLIDLTHPEVQLALSLKNAPHCFLDKRLARATAHFLRHTTAAQALRVPSMAFLAARDRWILVLFLEKLPADQQRFITAVEAFGTFRVGS